jgi:hypothetical protein
MNERIPLVGSEYSEVDILDLIAKRSRRNWVGAVFSSSVVAFHPTRDGAS